MTEIFFALQRATLFGVAALGVALFLQWILSNRVPARWRVWIWRAALIQTALALVPLAPIALAVLPAKAPVVAPKIAPAPAPPAIAPAIAPTVDDAPAVAASPDAQSSAPLPPLEIAPPTISQAPVAPVANARSGFKFSARELAIWVYLVGVAFQLALLGRNIARVRRALRVCEPLDNAVLRPLAARLKVRRVPRLLRSASGSPFLVGILRPTIVVPQTLNLAHLEAVFAHELAHYKRRDLSWNALLWALQTALWFHPLSWISRRFHALEVESACDELTLQLTPIAPKHYGALLIGAESSHSSPLVAGVNDNFFALQTRLKRLGRAPMQPRRRARALFLAILLISFATIVPLRLTARAQNAGENADATSVESVTGVVVNPSGAVLPGALISVEGLDGPGDSGPRGTVRADGEGRFVVPTELVKRPAQLFANWNERMSLHGSLVQSGDAVKLVLYSHVPTTIGGQIREEKTERPLPDVAIELFRKIDGGEVRVANVQSDEGGRFRFAELRPFRNYFMRFKSASHYRVGETVDVQRLSKGMTSRFGVVMAATNSRLRGRLLEPDGSPAVGYGVRVADGLGPIRGRPEVLTRSDGKFFFDNVTKGGVFLIIREPGAKVARFIKQAPTGDPNLISVRLSDKLRLAERAFDGQLADVAEKPDSDFSSLTGTVAPALRVRPEGDPPMLAELRTKTVLLCFKPYRYLSPIVGNFALSYQQRDVRVICVESVPIFADGITIAADGKVTYKGLYSPAKAVKEELGQIKWAKEYDDLPIDVAFDLPKSSDPNAPNSIGQSATLYQGAQYVVIGRDGLILYAGDRLDRAIETATASAN